MIEISEEMIILLYQNICNKNYNNKNHIPLVDFLEKESQKEESSNKKIINSYFILFKLYSKFRKNKYIK